jgi:hypothetical protein
VLFLFVYKILHLHVTHLSYRQSAKFQLHTKVCLDGGQDTTGTGQDNGSAKEAPVDMCARADVPVYLNLSNESNNAQEVGECLSGRPDAARRPLDAADEQHKDSTCSTSPTSTSFNTKPPTITPSSCLHVILSQNFDSTSIEAVVTIAKYISNVLMHPTDEKFRSINTNNKIFSQKLRVCKGNGVAEFFASVGFDFVQSTGCLVLRDDGPAESKTELLYAGWEALQHAMTELGIPVEDRPVLRKHLQSPSVYVPEVPVFDPFKVSVHRNAPQVC